MRKVFAAFLFTAICASAAPLVSIDFGSPETGRKAVASRDGLIELQFDDSVSFSRDIPTGLPCMEFSGAKSPVRIDKSRLGDDKFDGSAVSASFWVRCDSMDRAEVAFGLKSGGWEGCVEYTLVVPTKATEYANYSIYAKDFETVVVTGTWHHVAFNYSTESMTYNVWFDGRIQRTLKVNADTRNPVEDFFGLPFGRNFKGAIADVQIWNTVAGEEELLAMDVPPAAAAKAVAVFKAARADCGTPSIAAWIDASIADAESLGEKCAVSRWADIQDAIRNLPAIAGFGRSFAASPRSAQFASAPILPLSTYAFIQDVRKEWSIPSDAAARPEISFAAALGEFESRLLALYALDDVDGFTVSPGKFIGPGGATIPASALDIKVLKSWYIAPSAWNSYFAGGRELPTMAPELLLHDADLVRTQPGHRKNFLRLSYPDGATYKDISEFGRADSIPALNIYSEPVLDAKSLAPTTLRKGRIKYFWLTFHVPADATPGKYSGSLAFSAGGKGIGSMEADIVVHPFSLPKAATRYNIDKRFYGTWMGVPGLAGMFEYDGESKSHKKMVSFADAKLRLRNIYADLAAHNMLNPWTTSFSSEGNADLDNIQIDLMEETGLETRPLFGSTKSFDFNWCFHLPQFPPKGMTDISPEGQPELFRESLAAHEAYIKASFDRVEKRLGHRDIICSSIDEAGPGTVRREMPFFAIVMKNGGRAFTTSGSDALSSFITGANDTPASLNRSSAQVWHEGGSEVFTYAMPFSGPINPILWRRNKGIRLYMANFDGNNEYQFYGGTDIWNEFATDASGYAPFTIVFPAYDGIIDTLEWEALREGFDDVRYLTLLRRAARQAMRSSDKSLARRGRLDYAWAEGLDQESVPLDEMRAECARRIVALRKALSASGFDFRELSAY